MEPEDGVIWIYGLNDGDTTVAFSDKGVDALRDLIEMHRETENRLARVA